jgi:hypothetical protein
VTTCAFVTPTITSPHPDATFEDGIRASDVDGWALLGLCAFALAPRFASVTRERTDRWDLLQECGVVVHEVGHALGLRHEDADLWPIMGEGFWYRDIPGGCRAWARKTSGQRRTLAAWGPGT